MMDYDIFAQEELEEVLLEEELTDEDIGEHAHLVVYNDDHNTFDWVIQCFIEVLNHAHAQAEQLSLIIHFKGKATVKTAPKNILKPKKDALIDRGLSAVIEDGG
jgi:ATP-dependent Clp protease adaptor protein ClpS